MGELSQEVSKRLGSVGYNPNISHLYVGYNPFTNHLYYTKFLGHPSTKVYEQQNNDHQDGFGMFCLENAVHDFSLIILMVLTCIFDTRWETFWVCTKDVCEN